MKKLFIFLSIALVAIVASSCSKYKAVEFYGEFEYYKTEALYNGEVTWTGNSASDTFNGTFLKPMIISIIWEKAGQAICDGKTVQYTYDKESGKISFGFNDYQLEKVSDTEFILYKDFTGCNLEETPVVIEGLVYDSLKFYYKPYGTYEE